MYLQLAAALCFRSDAGTAYEGQVTLPRRVLLFENDKTKFEGGKVRLETHHNIDSLGDPDLETKLTIHKHALFTDQPASSEVGAILQIACHFGGRLLWALTCLLAY